MSDTPTCIHCGRDEELHVADGRCWVSLPNAAALVPGKTCFRAAAAPLGDAEAAAPEEGRVETPGCGGAGCEECQPTDGSEWPWVPPESGCRPKDEPASVETPTTIAEAADAVWLRELAEIVDDVGELLFDDEDRARLASIADRVEALATTSAHERPAPTCDPTFDDPVEEDVVAPCPDCAAVSRAIGTDEFMDPPDGGSPTLAEQVARMRTALTTAESALAAHEQESARLRWMLATATVRLGILRDRMEACDAFHLTPGDRFTGHKLSLEEIPAWIDEQRAALSSTEERDPNG